MLDLYKMYTTVNNKPPLNRERHPNGTISDNIWTSCFESSVCVEKLLNFAFFYTIHFWKRIGWKRYNCVCFFCYSIKHTIWDVNWKKSKVKPLICKHVVDASLKVITVVTVWSRWAKRITEDFQFCLRRILMDSHVMFSLISIYIPDSSFFLYFQHNGIGCRVCSVIWNW